MSSSADVMLPSDVPQAASESVPQSLEELEKSFTYNEEDLIEAVTHCASPSFSLPLFSKPPAGEAVLVRHEVDADDDESPVPDSAKTHRCNARHHNTNNLQPTPAPEIYVEYDDISKYTRSLETNSAGQKIVTWNDPVNPVPPPQYKGWGPPEQPEIPDADLRTGLPKYALGKPYLLELNKDGSIKVNHKVISEKYNYAEHCMIGNTLHLKFSKDEAYVANERPLTLKNGIKLTYGQINGLGGDFFGTYHPICFGKDFAQQCDYFIKAYNNLAVNPRTVDEISEILKTREPELAAIKEAKDTGASTEEAYKRLAKSSGFFEHGQDKRLTEITISRPNSGEFESPSYLRLAQLNLDHFGADAHTAYNAGHHCAMQEAAAGNLEKAYAMNAFADHFLGDCFAAGHIRTPRRILHGSNGDTRYAVNFAPDMCSKYMHDEDNHFGLQVYNRKGESWRAYGDAKLFDAENAENAKRLSMALQASADEVFRSFQLKELAQTNPEEYAAWYHAPVLESAWERVNHAPLFDNKGDIRVDLRDRTKWEFERIAGWPLGHSAAAWAWMYKKLRAASDAFEY